jgi:deoxyribodipyrimidine photo-lyase
VTAPVVVWFRNDLRLADNPALSAAARCGAPIVALYILDDVAPGDWRMGGASRWRLHQSLASLALDLAKMSVALTLRRGPADIVIEGVVAQCGAQAVYWNRLYEPWAMRRDGEIKSRLRARGLSVESFNGALLFEPTQLRTGKGVPFKVFTPFWRACLAALPPAPPLPAPIKLRAAPPFDSDTLAAWKLLPTKPDWAQGWGALWRCGESAAHTQLAAFLSARVSEYKVARDFVARDGTSRLSAALHFGELSPRQIWHEVAARAPETGAAFLREVGWREFCHHLLVVNPQLPDTPLDRSFDAFEWAQDAVAMTAWRQGRTGYPLVDAAMRELWTTGFMHNRARMVAGSFLVKHLLLPWQEGARWFCDTLIDADLANNACGWQWIAGCGADAAPYFRVFNPVLQGEKFDPEGAYVRRYIPELEALDAKYIHRPWEAPDEALRKAGLRLGETYPRPIVDHAKARARALAAYAAMRGAYPPRQPALAKPPRAG